MSKIGSVIALSTGGMAIFTMAYVGVATAQGASVRDVPPFSWVARDVPPPSDTPPPQAAPIVKDPAADGPPVPAMTAGVLSAFVMPSPFDSQELQKLQRKLTERLAAVDTTEKELAQRTRELDDWQRSLEARMAELTELRAGLEKSSDGDVGKDAASAASDDDPASWRAMAPLFEEGDADELAAKLADFEPDQAAQILNGLEAERAAVLLNALPTANYKPILDAWRRSKK